ncbi:5-oxoprolinase subunit B family protein [Natronohydrobacter thiooxidans]|uniref:5-oxoprolinase subunit B family protein n=1 Tax=Natronohydrobacter thiooxidans TaxID=87172 RepID=UPI000A83B161|nr:allophanate hydrolase subunit 1 [Natronohydrobacter thiooxidans]
MTAISQNTSATGDAPTIHALGVDGVLISFGSELTEPANRAALAFHAALSGADLPGLKEAATSLTSVYLRLDLSACDLETLRPALATLLQSRDWYDAPLPATRRLWRVPALFGTELAPQLEEAAALAGLPPQDAIAELCAAPLRVQTIGFAPGQPYLGQLPENWNLPRQTDLTPRVPEGALAVAIRQMVLFSVSTPTGWRHVGQTALRLFQPDRPDPFLLRPGDEVLFQPVSRAEFETIRRDAPNGGAVSERAG